MEVDTGVSVFLISETRWLKVWKSSTVKHKLAKVSLWSYSIKVLGEMEVTVQYHNQKETLNLLVITGEGPSLLGCNWLRHLRLNWCELYHVQSVKILTLEEVLNKHTDVFKEELGTVKRMEVKIHMDLAALPSYFRLRPVLLALRPRVEKELVKLVQDKVIEPVQFSEWGSTHCPCSQAKQFCEDMW